MAGLDGAHMLTEGVQIIRALLGGDQVSWSGEYFRVDAAKIWDLPKQPLEIAVAVSGCQVGR